MRCRSAIYLLTFSLLIFAHISRTQAAPQSSATTLVPVPLQPRPGAPLSGLSPNELKRFKAGKKLFAKQFTAAEGLGPVFNNSSCGACHGNPDPNSMPPLGGSSIGLSMRVTRFGMNTTGSFDPLEAFGGSLLQDNSIPVPASAPPTVQSCQENIPSQANISSRRLSTPTFGAGLVEAIPDADIIANLLNQQPPGKPHLVQAFEDAPGNLRVGRFGWKAQVATVLSFSADAALNELGITNRFLTQENAPNGDAQLLGYCDVVSDPEDLPNSTGKEFIDQVTDFQRFLAAPPQTPKSGMTGERIFRSIGCENCHTSSYTTSNARSLERPLRNKNIKPYSDFLLHDMGAAADQIAQGAAPTTFIRTAPLWGLALRSFFWHDGTKFFSSLSDLDSIIAAHAAPGSDALPSASKYSQLSAADKDLLHRFLISLGRREFDLNGDRRVDHYDISTFKTCYNSTQTISADELCPGWSCAYNSCAVADYDQDKDVNDADLSAFLLAYDEVQFDCDCNDQNDLEQIVQNLVPDLNNDGLPDNPVTCNTGLNSFFQTVGAMPYEPLHIGQPAQFIVMGAVPGSTVYIMADTSGLTGKGALVPGSQVCMNVPGSQNLLQLLGGPSFLTADANGRASIQLTVPNQAPFNQITDLAIQGLAISSSGVRKGIPRIMQVE